MQPQTPKMKPGMSESPIDLSIPAPLLWDVDLETLDPERHKDFIIKRILELGRPREVRWLIEHYNREDIIEVVKNTRDLDRKTANFWALHFGIPQEEIRCMNRLQTWRCSN